MHIIGIITSICFLIFWLSRAVRGAGDIADTANNIANIPRKRRFQKAANKSGFDLVESPIEAATVLMIATARMSDERRITDKSEAEIITQLCDNMQLEKDDADGLYRQMHSLTYDVVLPENALFPMLKILQSEIDRKDAESLAQMMEAVGASVHNINTEQKEFIRRFRERMNLGR